MKDAITAVHDGAPDDRQPFHPDQSRRLVAIEKGWVAGRTVAYEERERAATRFEHSVK
jgi:hypothetical protein